MLFRAYMLGVSLIRSEYLRSHQGAYIILKVFGERAYREYGWPEPNIEFRPGKISYATQYL